MEGCTKRVAEEADCRCVNIACRGLQKDEHEREKGASASGQARGMRLNDANCPLGAN